MDVEASCEAVQTLGHSQKLRLPACFMSFLFQGNIHPISAVTPLQGHWGGLGLGIESYCGRKTDKHSGEVTGASQCKNHIP